MVSMVEKFRHKLARWIGGYSISDERASSIFGSPITRAGVAIDQTTAMNIAAVFCAIQCRMDMFSMLPCGVFTKSDGKRIPVNNTVDYLISVRPNREMTARRFWGLMEQDKISWGRGIAEIQWDMAGRPRALWRIEPWRCRIDRDENGDVIAIVDGKDVIYDADMIRMPGFSDNGIDGKSVISHYGRESLGLAAATDQYGAKFFGEGGVPSGILEHPGTMSKPARDEMRKDWQETHSPSHGGENQRVAILWNGMKYNKISIPPEDMQFLETRQLNIEDISRWFKVPPHMLYHLIHAHHKNIEEQGIDFVRRSLMPEITDWEQEVNHKLLTPPKTYSKWNVHGLLRGDLAAQTTHFKEMFGISVYSPNNILEKLDENPVEGGDQRFIPLNMIPLDKAEEYFESVIKAKNSVSPPGDQTPDGKTEHQEPTGDVTEDPDEPMSDIRERMMNAAEIMFRDALGRMTRKETKAARRAAEQHNRFFSWMDEFYPSFEKQIAEAIEQPLQAYKIADGRASNTTSELLARLYVKESRQAFLEASECQPDVFKLRIEAVCQRIETDGNSITPDCEAVK